MPVSYSKIPLHQLLCHQVAYEIIDKVGSSVFDDWNIQEFEKSILGTKCSIHSADERFRSKLVYSLADLDETMPFLKFGESGQHYAYELFLSPPKYWGSRGAPLFWAYAARNFTYDKLPLNEDKFTRKYLTLVQTLNIPYGIDEYIFIDKFAAGGMSSGLVGGLFAKEAHAVLCERLRKYQ